MSCLMYNYLTSCSDIHRSRKFIFSAVSPPPINNICFTSKCVLARKLINLNLPTVQVLCHLTIMVPCIEIIFYYINPNKMHMLQSLFYPTTALQVSGVTITHLQEHKTTVTTASGNRYTVIERVKFTDKEYRRLD